MTEIAFIIPMNFGEASFFKLSSNPSDAEKVEVQMDSTYWCYERPSNTLHGWRSIFINDVSNHIFEGP